MEQQDDISELLRLAQDRGLRTAAEGLLVRFRVSCQQALDWHREAGRALAAEGLDTDVLRQGIEAWVERERQTLRTALKALLRGSV